MQESGSAKTIFVLFCKYSDYFCYSLFLWRFIEVIIKENSQ